MKNKLITEHIADEKTILVELPKVVGSINISHDVTCPYCYETMYDDLDREWWNENITDQLPDEEAYKSTFEINCKECGKPFIVDGFGVDLFIRCGNYR